MRVAIPIWQDRVSPMLDAARQLAVLDVQNGREISRRIEPMPQLSLPHLVRRIGEQGVSVIICGAISRQLESLLILYGITAIPWVRGQLEDVISAYLDGSLRNGRFFMPGCQPRHRGRGKGRGGKRRGWQVDHFYGRKNREDL